MSAVRAIVDLSVALDADTQVYPGDPRVELTPHATVDREGFNLLAVRMGSQSGTHCDAPRHFSAVAAAIDEVPLPLCAGPAVVLDVRHRAAREAIVVADLAPYRAALGPGVIALLHTGWSARYGSASYFDHPYLGEAACRALLEHGVRTIGLDAPSIDETPDEDHPGTGFPCHHLLAGVGGVVVENLTNLRLVDFPRPFVCVLPLRLTGADGAPTRAVAIDLG